MNFNKNNVFYYKSHWPHGDYFEDYTHYEYFQPLIDYWDKNNIDYKKFTLSKLRSTVVEKGLVIDSSKLKKNDLLKLLGAE